MNLPLILFVALTSLCNSTFAQKLHEPAEIFEILEKSKLSYEINSLDEEIPPQDQTFNLNTADFYREVDDNSMRTMEVKLSEEALVIKEEAEKHFRTQNYTKAREGYEQVLELHPEYSKLLTYIGQTYHNQGEKKKASEYYQKAIKNNYIDYMAHWFLGKYYLENNKINQALDEIMIAHILNRNHTLLIKDLTLVLQKAGYKYEAWEFNPQIRLSSPASQKVKIEYREEWLGYALAKALWAYEPNYRESMGVKEGEISILEEREALLGFYVGNATNKKTSKTPLFKSLDKLHQQQTIR